MALKNKKVSQKGFSLIELLLVVGIIGILSAVVVPKIITTASKYDSRAEARELAIQFKKAKLEAVKRNRDVWIDFDFVDNEYQIFVNVDRDTALPNLLNTGAGDILLVTKRLKSNVQLISTTFADGQAGYNSRGLPLNLGTIVLGNVGSRSYSLSVSSTGRVVIQ